MEKPEKTQNGSEAVKNEPKHAKLTVRSVLKLIQSAKSSGVQYLKFGDFEVSFGESKPVMTQPFQLQEKSAVSDEPKKHPDSALFFDGV